MLRSNKTAISVLQKTYDESYLTCSTAVYYEGQGNEDEAMRCWKLALDRIYDHHANRILPNFTPTSETEKALVESVRRLELQCKERIDLLEALRLSRQELSQNVAISSEGCDAKTHSEPRLDQNYSKGFIGGGTIPAVAYRELSRPALPPRPSMGSRTSSEDIRRHAAESEAASSSSLPPSSLPTTGGKGRASPERHTMRTTLRPGRLGEKSSQSAPRRSASKPLEGPGASKAATLAWTALGQRERNSPGSSIMSPPQPPPGQSSPLEPSRQSLEASQRRWDSHTRRLVTPRASSPTKQSDERCSPEVGTGHNHARLPDHPGFSSPNSLSVSAAANALNSLNLRDSSTRVSPDGERLTRQRTAPPYTPRSGLSGKIGYFEGGSPGDLAARVLNRKTSSDSAIIARKPVSQGERSTLTPIRPTRSAETGQSTTGSRDSRAARRSSSSSIEEATPESRANYARRRRKRPQEGPALVTDALVKTSESSAEEEDNTVTDLWKKRKLEILRKLPPGVDETAAKQILNEIVVRGDEVHWSDIAGLEVAKNALREAVVYPFLRPDLFMGLREPARGMLLFGPPGTGKTMLARAVATESKSTFFSISASSLTSKYLGESEKLVRALFALAKLLAPSIIFVDEIDSLLSKRSGSGEHEATRRIKTEFLIQWSDLQRAAAGRESQGDRDKDRGDANRVLVLAATNLPWIIDEAARRRFVRRQYIPLPESETRAVQIRTLLSQQKHTLSDEDINVLVGLTDGFSGSDITALAKDAAMGPLRSLGEALLHMTMDEIRPIGLSDFVASLTTIRPSVSRASLKEYEDWAKEFGERGG
ncbi:P-loop containing nucleoside triphosphate hydrolase protein [Immersiella caudata]|uniref:P-loop containing nucleoside triphosphate hydrolase protein n=1 Tax=Immersiella caudata TaxID=314043 RepID=A0AA39U520_9PEZI|nr:P-loop containing nucleoside triphosphate hydrolase protein [Immersiella caudata]